MGSGEVRSACVSLGLGLGQFRSAWGQVKLGQLGVGSVWGLGQGWVSLTHNLHKCRLWVLGQLGFWVGSAWVLGWISLGQVGLAWGLVRLGQLGVGLA